VTRLTAEKSEVKILVIDDESAICGVLSASLKDEGYVVDVAADGQQGLEKLNQFRPDIVLLDIWMPGDMDGLEVLRRAKPNFPSTQFIMMSGHGTIETAVKAVKLGAWDFVEKPLSIDKISILISNILSRPFKQTS
jgi:two-component system nitrogen regulation response regulator NtrX